MFPLTSQELAKLKQLNRDSVLVEGFKKLLVNAFIGAPMQGVDVLAAQNLSIKFLNKAFNDLSHLVEEEGERKTKENIV